MLLLMLGRKASGISPLTMIFIYWDFDTWPFRLRKFSSIPSLFSLSDVFSVLIEMIIPVYFV